MFKLSTIVSAFLLASTSASATSIIDYSFATQNLKKITPELRASTCSAFNKEVMAINRFIIDNDLPTKLVSTNLCTYIHISEGQLENTLSFDSINLYNSTNSWAGAFSEKIDVTQEMELIVFSQPGVTQYLYYSDANAVLKKQGYKVQTPDAYAPGPLGVIYNPSGVGVTAAVFNRSSNAIYVTDAKCSGINSEESCVPGGRQNSKYWILDKISPLNSTDNATVFQTDTTSIGFDFSVTGGLNKDGPSAQISTGFNFGTSSSNGSERKAVNVVVVKEANDSGLKATWYLDPSVISAAPTMGTNSEPTSYEKSDKYFGASAYRDLDLSTNGQWREIINKSNCSPEPDKNNRDIKFTSDLYIERGAYDLEGSGSSARWDYSSDSNFIRKNLSHTVTVRTQCQTDALGGLIRVVLPGILN
ncbi:hypothetical protein [Moritella viscosa]|uniref:Uncharacterized protein n=1 Tax=Moritella viscosa TaxID=80854 RepID=A0A090IHW4_9GAMM|nr:hypothetical protein [Moritella viscosa]CED59599.1 putative exported protein [Moritella viscosa]SGY87104.1 Putative uncharacterized protein [Moritella viscosa]SGY88815.1 Putative uncharacterized protein [Moritella viscosa]SGY90922.1 Putative uncharacterized protein [Moritella viscosa]SGY91327.1 Putative uncharacterized protein [Moritella viscosa]